MLYVLQEISIFYSTVLAVTTPSRAPRHKERRNYGLAIIEREKCIIVSAIVQKMQHSSFVKFGVFRLVPVEEKDRIVAEHVQSNVTLLHHRNDSEFELTSPLAVFSLSFNVVFQDLSFVGVVKGSIFFLVVGHVVVD